MSKHFCKYCGAELGGKGSHKSKICDICRGVEGHYDEKYKKKKAEEQQIYKKIETISFKDPKLDRKKCRTCLYRLHLGEGDKVWHCGYCYYTGHMRPCEISSDCSVYKTYSEKKRRQLIYELKNKI